MGLSFKIAAGLRQRSHSEVRIPQDSRPHFTVSDSRLPHSGGLGPCIYIPHEQGCPVIPPGTGFPFSRLPWLAGLRWRYSTPTSPNSSIVAPRSSRTDRVENTASQLLHWCKSVATITNTGCCLQIHYLATGLHTKIFSVYSWSNQQFSRTYMFNSLRTWSRVSSAYRTDSWFDPEFGLACKCCLWTEYLRITSDH
jgi:hypothetical protein